MEGKLATVGFTPRYKTSTREQRRTTVSEFVTALKRCIKQRDLESGKQIHKDALSVNFHTNKYVASVLITMYCKCRELGLAKEVFDTMTQRDVVLWNCLIMGYVENGEHISAMDLFTSMDCSPDSVTYIAALKASGGLPSKRALHVEKIHREVIDRGLDSDIILGNTLVDVYTKCGAMQRAQETFDCMKRKDVITWTSLILGYVSRGEFMLAYGIYTRMDCQPDSFTYVAALKACAGLAGSTESENKFSLDNGVVIHEQVRNRGMESDLVVATALVDMYSKCGKVLSAREVFDRMTNRDVVLWNSLLLGYVENGQSKLAVKLFARMDSKPSSVTYVAILKAYGELMNEETSCLEKIVSIHQEAQGLGFMSDLAVSNTLIDIYSKSGSMSRAKEVFDGLISRNTVSWNSLILGYVENSESSVAVELYTRMDCEASSVTYVAALKACGGATELQTGRDVHGRVCRAGVEKDTVVATTLIDFYGKCGEVTKAEEVFGFLHSPNAVSWTTLMAAYSSLGDSARVVRLAKEMAGTGVEMDTITFVCLLTSCSHAGLEEEGGAYFRSLLGDERAKLLTVEHYNCMVDLLGRGNRLEEALEVVKRMPLPPNVVTWMTLLGACRKWRNVEIGKVAFDGVAEVGGEGRGAAYVLMSDIYRSLKLEEFNSLDFRELSSNVSFLIARGN